MNPVTQANVEDLLGVDLDDAQAAVVLQLTAGWIIGATSFDSLSGVLTQDVWAAWLELACLAADNPTSLASNQAGEEVMTWAAGPASRMTAILAGLTKRYPPATPAASGPQGAFPRDLSDWPDSASIVDWPIRRHWAGWWWR